MPKINLLNTSNRSNSNYSNTIKYDETIKSINTKLDTLIFSLNTYVNEVRRAAKAENDAELSVLNTADEVTKIVSLNFTKDVRNAAANLKDILDTL